MEMIANFFPVVIIIAVGFLIWGLIVVFDSDHDPNYRIFFTILMILDIWGSYSLLTNRELNDILIKQEHARQAAKYEANKPALLYKLDNGCEVYSFDRHEFRVKYFTRCPNSQVTTETPVTEGKTTRDEVITTNQR